MFDYNSYYNRVSEIFNEIRLDKDKEILKTTSIIKNYISDKSKVLDVGCGTGRYAYALKNQGYDVIGIDKSESQVMQAKKMINVIRGNAIDLPFEDDSFELCILIMVIQQLSEEELVLALDEVKRILKKNGFLIIKTCSHEDLKKRNSNKYFPSAMKLNMNRYPPIHILEKKLLNLDYSIVRKVKTEVIEPINSDEWIFSIEKKHNSTLALLSEEEFQRGLALIRKDYPNIEKIYKKHYHTYIVAKK